MDYPKRSPFFAHKFVRLLQKSCAAMDIGQSACLFLCYIAHTEDAMRYSGPVRFWNEQLMTVMGFKSPKQLNEARSKAEAAGWLVYDRSGNRQVGRYWVTIPDQFEGLDDSPIEENHSVNHSESGTNSGMNNGTKAERIGDELRNEKVTESGKPSIPSPNPIYSPGADIQIPASMNTPEVLSAVNAWFRHLEFKDKPEKIPESNSPQEQAFWMKIAKYGPVRFVAAANHTMAEGWVGLREPDDERSRKSVEIPEDLLKICTTCKQHPQDPAKRREILGPKLHEISRRLDVQVILGAIGDNWKMKSLNEFYQQHLKDIESK